LFGTGSYLTFSPPPPFSPKVGISSSFVVLREITHFSHSFSPPFNMIPFPPFLPRGKNPPPPTGMHPNPPFGNFKGSSFPVGIRPVYGGPPQHSDPLFCTRGKSLPEWAPAAASSPPGVCQPAFLGPLVPLCFFPGKGRPPPSLSSTLPPLCSNRSPNNPGFFESYSPPFPFSVPPNSF